MKIGGRTCLLCNCEGTLPIDASAVGKTLGTEVPHVAHQLCRAELDRVAEAGLNGPLLIACTQERAVFGEALENRFGTGGGPAPDLAVTNIREQAGWSDEAAAATPKIAALLAEAALALPPVPVLTLKSEGVALIYGRDETAIDAARRLAATLDVTVLLTGEEEVPPPSITDFPVLKGIIRTVKGHLGAFELVVDRYAVPVPSSRRSLIFGPSKDGAVSRCDLILDLSGRAPLFPAGPTRDGYVRADPVRPSEVARAILEAADLVGEFDKPRYVDYRADLCAHSRNRRTGCTRCLDVCPTGAIVPDGDHVAIDPYICAGCGNCHAVCPTGAATYALPPPDRLLDRVRTLLTTYARAGGIQPVLLVHDGRHGTAAIELLARQGAGLPARVIPMAVNEITQLGIEFFATALAMGAAEVRILAIRQRPGEMEALARVLGLAETAASGLGYGSGRCGLIEADDPEELGHQLRAMGMRDGTATPRHFLPLGDKRALMRLSLRQMHAAAPEPIDLLPLPPGAPFGGIEVQVDGCTLCLSCVGVCPTGALSDNPDKPQLSFTEDACVQCGLCKSTCPEKVIRLVPQLDFTDRARQPRVLKEEEPAHCLRCGKPFGVKSSIDRIAARLLDKHWMYQGPNNPIDRVRMCADCRVIAHTESNMDPYAGPARPLPRTTEDYRR